MLDDSGTSESDFSFFANNNTGGTSLATTATDVVANFILVPIGPASGPPRITTKSLPDAFFGQAYFQTLLVTNAAQSFDWSFASGMLPDGLSQDSFLGSISGTPTAIGFFNFTVQITYARGSHAVSAVSI